MKRNWGFLSLAMTLAFFTTNLQATAVQTTQPSTASAALPQVQNQASSHDRHHRRHSNSKHHHRHRSSETKH